MTLTDLEPRFVRYETRTETYDTVNGQVTGPRDYRLHVDLLWGAQGIQFLCPACFTANQGPVGTHAIDVTFKDRGVPDTQGSHNRDGKPSRWAVSGTDFTNLSLAPSIDVGCWHGYITNGEAK